jgi:hypothetical protein
VEEMYMPVDDEEREEVGLSSGERKEESAGFGACEEEG